MRFGLLVHDCGFGVVGGCCAAVVPSVAGTALIISMSLSGFLAPASKADICKQGEYVCSVHNSGHEGWNALSPALL